MESDYSWWFPPMKTELGQRIRNLFKHPCDAYPYAEGGFTDDRGHWINLEALLRTIRYQEDQMLERPRAEWSDEFRPDWDTYFLDIAEAVAARSDCERDKVGAVIVRERRIRATGYNGAAAGKPGCESCPRRLSGCAPGSSYDEGPGRCVANHAEANALIYSNREDLIDATIYITRKPCYACSKLIEAAGITRVVTPEDI